MNKMKLYCDYVDNQRSPIWLVMEQFKWTSSVIYIPINSYETDDITNFHCNELSATVLLSDLVVSEEYPDQIGINLNRIEQRINNSGLVKEDVTKLYIRIVDINEVIDVEKLN
ncbi:hypothetical protein F9U64_01365 [Gracilibacillus oryzae]|uniref:Uncharacterized protein n=1 Tax=Gracilibacillus oryzae TaxID=1672701 RepID=A0A7C8L1L5_9BACI|nr:hypothetical protein [Gracilibacillus oryzae]KAB8139074.1 hypothetical protein F9U64_01365 [Gracilibacillus oryzae]